MPTGSRGTVYQVGSGVNLDRLDTKVEQLDSKVADLEKSLAAAAGQLVAMRLVVEDLRGKVIPQARLDGRRDYQGHPYRGPRDQSL